MYTIHSVVDVDDFCLPGDDPGFRAQVAGLWATGEGRPDWSFVLDDDGTRVGRLAFRVEDTVPDPALLGALPPTECYVYGLALPEHEAVRGGAWLLCAALERIGRELPDVIQSRVNREQHRDHVTRRALFEGVGFELFQEKAGFLWTDDDAPLAEPRLTLRPIDDMGRDTFVDVMARTAAGTLDRNDAWYQARMTPTDWATVMAGFLEPGDEPGWLVGETLEGETVGFVALSRWSEPGMATITHIGVVPEMRGRGHVHGLLAAAARAGRAAGIRRIIADVDVHNEPMLAAMRAAGYREEATAWHIWHYRGAIPVVLDGARRRAGMRSVKESSPLRVAS